MKHEFEIYFRSNSDEKVVARAINYLTGVIEPNDFDIESWNAINAFNEGRLNWQNVTYVRFRCTDDLMKEITFILELNRTYVC